MGRIRVRKGGCAPLFRGGIIIAVEDEERGNEGDLVVVEPAF